MFSEQAIFQDEEERGRNSKKENLFLARQKDQAGGPQNVL